MSDPLDIVREQVLFWEKEEREARKLRDLADARLSIAEAVLPSLRQSLERLEGLGMVEVGGVDTSLAIATPTPPPTPEVPGSAERPAPEHEDSEDAKPPDAKELRNSEDVHSAVREIHVVRLLPDSKS